MFDCVIWGLQFFIAHGLWWVVAISMAVTAIIYATLQLLSILQFNDLERLRIERQHEIQMANLLVEQTRIYHDIERLRWK